MFLKTVMNRNPQLIETAVQLHQTGQIMPDTYVLDYDQILENARNIYNEATAQGIILYFMLKQIGRNPVIAQALCGMGYAGAVVVDFREAQTMMAHHIPLGNVGHLVQTPRHLLREIMEYGAEVFTVFSFEKLHEIHATARSLGIIQEVILKVVDEQDVLYRGQEAGIELSELEHFLNRADSLDHIRIVGATAFPAFVYAIDAKDIQKTPNYDTIMSAVDLMKNRGLDIKQINAPSTTSVHTLKKMNHTGITHGEPGHGLSGTTPAHAYRSLIEGPSVVYVSEISHNFRHKGYCYGGGHYRRSHVHDALIIEGNHRRLVKVMPMDPTAIDYYFELNTAANVSSTVIMAFRFQIFVTRSRVALIKGIHKGNPELIGIYDSSGRECSA